MKKALMRMLALFLCLLMIGNAVELPALAADRIPEERHFEDAVIPAERETNDLFLFGSSRMKVSEKSRDHWLSRVVRTGDCTGEAEVTVKFTDLSAEYGENYTILGPGGTKPEVSPDRFSLVSFLTENSENTADYAMPKAEELAPLIQAAGGYDLLDSAGNIAETVTLTQDENGNPTLTPETAPPASAEATAKETADSTDGDLRFPDGYLCSG